MKNRGISVIICCYNSALLLEPTLKRIANQILDGDLGYELIVVDNASIDDTKKIARNIWAKIGSEKINFIIIHEPEPGLANARKKGISIASYNYLIFCDDDNWLDKNYFKNVAFLFDKNPEVALLGGIGIAQIEDESVKPDWFADFYQSYAIGKQADDECLVKGVYGAGMAVRKSVLTSVIDHLPMYLSGRSKNQLTAGEDSEICHRIRLAGFKILFTPKLTFKHFLTGNRLTWAYVKKLHTGFAKTYVVLNLYDKVLCNEKVDLFYWLKQGLYFSGIYLKYWPKFYFTRTKKEGRIKEIHLLTWKKIACDYFKFNFKTVKIYNDIRSLKQANLK
jgi:glycosyltransferase involved in cell wall biosynthesis